MSNNIMLTIAGEERGGKEGVIASVKHESGVEIISFIPNDQESWAVFQGVTENMIDIIHKGLVEEDGG